MGSTEQLWGQVGGVVSTYAEPLTSAMLVSVHFHLPGVRFFCSPPLSLFLSTHNKDLKVQSEKHYGNARREPAGLSHKDGGGLSGGRLFWTRGAAAAPG